VETDSKRRSGQHRVCCQRVGKGVALASHFIRSYDEGLVKPRPVKSVAQRFDVLWWARVFVPHTNVRSGEPVNVSGATHPVDDVLDCLGDVVKGITRKLAHPRWPLPRQSVQSHVGVALPRLGGYHPLVPTHVAGNFVFRVAVARLSAIRRQGVPSNFNLHE
jgi:hypothetical protein